MKSKITVLKDYAAATGFKEIWKRAIDPWWKKVYVAEKVRPKNRASSVFEKPIQAEDGHWYVPDEQEYNWVPDGPGEWTEPTPETAPDMYYRVPGPESDSDDPPPPQVPDKSLWKGKEPLPYAPRGGQTTKPLDFHTWYTGFGYDERVSALNANHVDFEVSPHGVRPFRNSYRRGAHEIPADTATRPLVSSTTDGELKAAHIGARAAAVAAPASPAAASSLRRSAGGGASDARPAARACRCPPPPDHASSAVSYTHLTLPTKA